MKKRPAASPDEIAARFHAAVNMTAEELQSWLARPESLLVGTIRPGESESVGRQYGRRIITLLTHSEAGPAAAEPGPEDLRAMRKVISYIARHTAQRPRGDITRSRWRFALMNWGHDPVKREFGLD